MLSDGFASSADPPAGGSEGLGCLLCGDLRFLAASVGVLKEFGKRAMGGWPELPCDSGTNREKVDHVTP